MSGAEERIRLKAEAALRIAFPDARIIHELVVKQGSCRLDLAAVTPQRLILVEIKSELDVLDRLKRQAEQAREVADGFSVVCAEKHWRKAWEGHHVSIIDAAKEDELDIHFARSQRSIMEATCNAPARLNMLWASELRVVAETGAKASRGFSIRQASDNFTGREIRLRVCAALRARHFPRADAPIESDLFPFTTRFAA